MIQILKFQLNRSILELQVVQADGQAALKARMSGGGFWWSMFWMGGIMSFRLEKKHREADAIDLDRPNRRAGQCSSAITSVAVPPSSDSCIGGFELCPAPPQPSPQQSSYLGVVAWMG
jgi:hypothetical protein